MIKNCVFQLPNDSKDKMAETFNLNHILSNDRTMIFQNDEMRFCVDKKVVRVIIFDEANICLLEKIRHYFYGDEYDGKQLDKKNRGHI